jgi:hypothetical protein
MFEIPASKIFWYLVTAVMAMNGYFVRGLVVSIESTAQEVSAIHEKLMVLETKFYDLEREIRSNNVRKKNGE